ncbi:zinc finger CCCH domain-containing protein 15 homolog [Sitodiplosis mosellana]|uniref:zinc finger CCCH domain-containing protein 15 homolog n=1 Tax=Sitodiplosis mosellana TaxID=263140 RepID=UPI00244461A2|nr:zinc finger CCCH domain-containing protein 15 homolog [Sitodiplosis mosellana]
MPPKKAAAGASKKTEAKKKDKIIEDKTFGLKNKKGAKTQKFIQQVEKQVKSGGQHPLLPTSKKDEKEKKLQEQKELNALFRPVQTQKVEKGTDPKSVVCAFFKAGQCGKGEKCKFSHDLSVERKVEKRSMYVDMRDGDENDTMDNWNDEKLKEVVEKKHGKEKRMPTTDIICKFFLDAVEKSKYGWFWECPNGEKCIYRHALPQGYILKKDKKKMDEQKKPDISLVDLIERERNALGSNLTKVTLESFLAWKKRKIQEKKDLQAKEEEQKRKDYKSGKQFGFSGREMFSFNPELAKDNDLEDDDGAYASYEREEDDNDQIYEYKELDLDELAAGAQEADGTGTVATEDRLKKPVEEAEGEAAGAAGDVVDATPFNENLFLDEEVLDGLEDELNELDLNDNS